VVTLNMLILKMRIEDLSIGEHAQDLVVQFPSVNEFVTCLCLQGTAETNNIPEYNLLWPSDWSDCFQII